VIDDNCLIDAKGQTNRGIRIGNGVFIGRNTILSCKNGDIEVEDGANIGFNCELFSASRVTIGRSVLMAAYTYVIGGDHDFSDPSRAVLAQTRTSAGVVIGEGAWLGAGARILDGVRIGDHAVVGAGSVVREDVPAYAVAVGIPARVVSTRGS
jgi:acetyltransferase-like isoleucine patch superfamily enzyme